MPSWITLFLLINMCMAKIKWLLILDPLLASYFSWARETSSNEEQTSAILLYWEALGQTKFNFDSQGRTKRNQRPEYRMQYCLLRFLWTDSGPEIPGLPQIQLSKGPTPGVQVDQSEFPVQEEKRVIQYQYLSSTLADIGKPWQDWNYQNRARKNSAFLAKGLFSTISLGFFDSSNV